MDVIYLAGGQGIRASLGYPKQYAYICGKLLLMYGIEVLESIKEINRIIVVADDICKVSGIVFAYNSKKCEVIEGGSTRQKSVFEGLRYVTTDKLLICEAVRPFITKEFVETIINSSGNVIPYTRLNSTPFNKKTGSIYKREDVVCVQTPQKYNSNELIESHNYAFSKNINNCTDDLDLMKKVGLYPNFNYIEGLIDNIKITYPIDLISSEAIFKYRGGKDE